MVTSRVVISAAIAAASVTCQFAAADTITITPSKDNTLIQDTNGALSNGQGPIFSGRLGNFAGNLRIRAVMAFDVAGNVPAGATITSATLALRLIMAPNNAPNQTHALHKITADWGEGTSATDAGNGAPSTPGDATWKHRFFDTQNWTTLGGDFLATVSAQQTVGTDTLNDYTWSSTQMVADVQGWLNNPATNFGWLLQGNETSTMTARKFHSREDFDATVRPRLTIVYTPAPVCAGDVNHNHVVDVNDLLAVVSTWGPCPAPCPPPCTADISPTGSGNCVVDVNDLLAVISSWGPCP